MDLSLYTRIGRSVRKSGLSSAETGTVYLGKDHVLVKTAEYFSENYRRLYFRDIQLIHAIKTNGREIGAGVLGAFGLVFLLFTAFGGLFRSWDIALLWTLGFISFVFWFFATMIWVRGPTCKVFVQTRVGQDHLFSLNHLRHARLFIEKVVPEIQQAQGPLIVQERPAVTSPEPYTSVTTERSPGIRPPILPLLPIPPKIVKLLRVHALVLGLFTLTVFVDFLFVGLWNMVLPLAFGVTGFVMGIFLVSESHVRRRPMMKTTTWLSLTITSIFMLVWYVGISTFGAADSGVTILPAEMMASFAQINMTDAWGWSIYYLSVLGLSLVTTLLSLWSLAKLKSNAG